MIDIVKQILSPTMTIKFEWIEYLLSVGSYKLKGRYLEGVASIRINKCVDYWFCIAKEAHVKSW